jgi:hypothetical protein
MNRRKFIKVGSSVAIVASGVLSFPSSINAAVNIKEDKKASFYKVFVDNNSDNGKIFATEMLKYGHSIHFVGNDITELWSNDLSNQWKVKPQAIAGLTTFEVFTAIEQMAKNSWMGVAYKGIHQNNFEHQIIASDVIRKNVSNIMRVKPWPNAIAQVLSNISREEYKKSKDSKVLRTNNKNDLNNEQLISWIITPRILNEG